MFVVRGAIPKRPVNGSPVSTISESPVSALSTPRSCLDSQALSALPALPVLSQIFWSSFGSPGPISTLLVSALAVSTLPSSLNSAGPISPLLSWCCLVFSVSTLPVSIGLSGSLSVSLVVPWFLSLSFSLSRLSTNLPRLSPSLSQVYPSLSPLSFSLSPLSPSFFRSLPISLGSLPVSLDSPPVSLRSLSVTLRSLPYALSRLSLESTPPHVPFCACIYDYSEKENFIARGARVLISCEKGMKSESMPRQTTTHEQIHPNRVTD